MKKTLIQTIAPLLRGLTFDKEKGAIVVYSEESGPNEAEIVRIDLPSEIIDAANAAESNADSGAAATQLPSEIVETLNQVLVKALANQPKIGTVCVNNVGYFSLGHNYDGAVKAEGTPVNAKAGTNHEPVFDRNAVVKNKVAVVTGGAQGFGEGIVRQLIAAGAHVCIADMNLDGATKLAERLNSHLGKTKAFAVKVNVSQEDSVAEMVNEITRTLGGIDLFIANAGVLKAGSVKDISLKDFEFVTDVNYIGYFLCAKHSSRIMALQNVASGEYFTDIIQINSKSGLEGSNKNGAYAGGKFGGIGLTQSFAKELIEDNIKVNSICPGNFFDGPLWSHPERGLFVQYLNTGKVPGAKTIEDVKKFYEAKVPMRRGCDGKDVSKAIFYCIEQRYETGQAVPVTGGQIMLK